MQASSEKSPFLEYKRQRDESKMKLFCAILLVYVVALTLFGVDGRGGGGSNKGLEDSMRLFVRARRHAPATNMGLATGPGYVKNEEQPPPPQFRSRRNVMNNEPTSHENNEEQPPHFRPRRQAPPPPPEGMPPPPEGMPPPPEGMPPPPPA
ncbi:uncharacterized protein Dmoj_GI18668, isoform A [Drosophila mojavensis]|uniref:Uncharacterized protein, isoform A n=2 Tax=Drosophila mojavensis TaxID=7230 RepID=B4KPJ5_DROMO|nr:uncharacterized protein Dmoj_GI18668, isoform A [Drosophila mojavensis]